MMINVTIMPVSIYNSSDKFLNVGLWIFSYTPVPKKNSANGVILIDSILWLVKQTSLSEQIFLNDG